MSNWSVKFIVPAIKIRVFGVRYLICFNVAKTQWQMVKLPRCIRKN